MLTRIAVSCISSLLLSSAAFSTEAYAEFSVFELKDNKIVRGVVLRETDKTYTLRTWLGDRTIQKSEIRAVLKSNVLKERADALSRVDPKQDLAAFEERQKQLAAQRNAGSIDSPKLEAPVTALSKKVSSEPTFKAPSAPDNRFEPAIPSRTGHWAERISRALDRQVTLELSDSPFTESMELLSTLTGITIVINPRVREAGRSVNLAVRDMSAANVLKWLTRLTDTYIEVKDGAIYITDQPDANNDETHRELALLAAQYGIDPGLLPPQGVEVSNAELTRIALAIWEKTNPKVPDFPGPDFGLDPPEAQNPFSSIFPGP